MANKILDHNLTNKVVKDLFVLKKDFGKHKQGDVFDCFSGLISGISDKDGSIEFSDKAWFEYVQFRVEVRTQIIIEGEQTVDIEKLASNKKIKKLVEESIYGLA